MKRLANQGFTLIEIMIVVAIIALLAAIAIPNVLRGRTSANEAAAIGNVRALVSSMEMYRSVQQNYPATTTFNLLYDAAAAAGADPNCAAATLPNPDFGPSSFCASLTDAAGVGAPPAGSDIQGYNYNYTGPAAAGQTYSLVAIPVTPQGTGTRGFCADQLGLVRHCSCPAGACVVTPQAAGAGCNVAMATIDAAPDMNTATAALDPCA